MLKSGGNAVSRFRLAESLLARQLAVHYKLFEDFRIIPPSMADFRAPLVTRSYFVESSRRVFVSLPGKPISARIVCAMQGPEPSRFPLST